MRKYYLIPLTDIDIYLNDISLKKMLAQTQPVLAQRENERIDILYSVSPLIGMPRELKEKYNRHIAETRKMYDEFQIPRFLIAYGTDICCAEEILTKRKIHSDYIAALEVREATFEKVREYYDSTNYREKIKNLFHIENVIDDPFGEFYEVEGYIEGKLSDKDVKGIFKGKIKIKKLF